jgi:hypothetical protein
MKSIIKNSIKYMFLVFVACAAYSHVVFAAAEANPRQRSVAGEYIKQRPVGIPDLANIFEKYAEPLTFRDVSRDLEWPWDPNSNLGFFFTRAREEGHSIDIKPDLDDTFETFKEKIAEAFEVPVEDIFLEFEGKPITTIQNFSAYVLNNDLYEKSIKSRKKLGSWIIPLEIIIRSKVD